MLKGKGLLTPIQRRCLALFARVADQDRFYLTGGTALAEFFLGHRISFDLDLFTSEEGLILPFAQSMEGRFTKEGWGVKVVKRFSTYAEFELSLEGEELRLDLALDSPFKLDEPSPCEHGVRVNGYRDLVAEKTLAFYGRTEPRDAVDLYFILRQESFGDLLALASHKDPGFDNYWFSVALNKSEDYPDELERWPVKMLVAFQPSDLKGRFRELAMELMGQVINP